MPVNSPLQRQMAALVDQHFDTEGKCAFCGWGNSHSRQFGSTRAKHLAGSTPGVKACACVPEGLASELRALQAQHQQQQLFAQPPNSAPHAAAAAAEAADLAGSKRAPRALQRLADELAAPSADDASGVTPEAVQRLYDTHFTFITLTADDGVVIHNQETAGLPPGVTRAVIGEADGLSDEDKTWLYDELVEAGFVPDADDPVWHGTNHVHIPFSRLLGSPGGLKVLDFLRGPSSPLFKFLGTLRIPEFTVVVRYNRRLQHNPNHRDKLTGSPVFKRGYKDGICTGFRALLDCGPGRRCMDYSVGSSLSELEVVHTRFAGLQLMDAPCAGHACCSNVHHGRRQEHEPDAGKMAAALRATEAAGTGSAGGPGTASAAAGAPSSEGPGDAAGAAAGAAGSNRPSVTFQLGFAAPLHKSTGYMPHGAGAVGSANRVVRFFRPGSTVKGVGFLQVDNLGTRLTAEQSAEARAAAAAEAAEAAGGQPAEQHCGWCGAPYDGGWRVVGGWRWCGPCGVALSASKSGSSEEEWAERPGACVCGPTGCEGCREPEVGAGVWGGGVAKHPKNHGWKSTKKTKSRGRS